MRRAVVLAALFLGMAAIAATLALRAAPAAVQPLKVALTFDDLPGADTTAPLEELRDQNRRILAAVRDAGATATGFVNEGRLQKDGERDARVALLAAWLDAGCDLGNHTEAHLGLSATPLREYEDGVVRGEAVTRALLEARGRKLQYFRHPFTQTGPTPEIKEAFEAFLRERGYTIAPFTIEAADYLFAALDEDARRAGDRDRAARIRAAYLAHNEAMFDWFAKLAREEFGRDIPHVLLAHVNRLNADLLPDLLARLRARGWVFVPLGEALADPAYATPDRYVGKNGPSWLHRWSVALRKPMRLRDEPDPPPWILDASAARNAAPPATKPRPAP
ncbi:MAG TPA: polysaccharide deacetylase family protein [Candidatus Polarisedimenticolia bacterium]|nr:polysaccharide deacetylase family protein [Candidatus Polarisedimenticolia bacterium]